MLIRRQTGLSRGVKDILVTGMTVTTLLTSVATASAQNIFEALFGRVAPAPGPVPDANFTARDRQQLAHPPYQQAWIPPAYRRQVVRYHRQEAPGTMSFLTDDLLLQDSGDQRLEQPPGPADAQPGVAQDQLADDGVVRGKTGQVVERAYQRVAPKRLL